jgi:hypothetical protein
MQQVPDKRHPRGRGWEAPGEAVAQGEAPAIPATVVSVRAGGGEDPS